MATVLRLAAREGGGSSAGLPPTPHTRPSGLREARASLGVRLRLPQDRRRGCSATTLRDRRDEWIELGVIDALREVVLEAYDRLIGLELSDVAVDGCITKAPCGGQKAGRSPLDRGKRGIKRSGLVDAQGIPLGAATAPRSEEHTSELQSRQYLVCRLLLEKK